MGQMKVMQIHAQESCSLVSSSEHCAAESLKLAVLMWLCEVGKSLVDFDLKCEEAEKK